MCEILTQHGSVMVTCLRLRLEIDNKFSTDGFKFREKKTGYSWIQMWHGLCTEQPGSWLSDCMFHFFFLFILPCPLFSSVVWIMTMTKQPHQEWKQLCIVTLMLKDISGVSYKCGRCDSVSLYLTHSVCDSEIGGIKNLCKTHDF